MLRALKSAFAAAVVTVAALATPAAAQPYNWTGLYVGAHLGAGWAGTDWSNIDLTTEASGMRDRGFIGGGQVGFNLQQGSFVYGLEFTLSGANLDGTTPSAVASLVTYGTSVHWFSTTGLRLGYAADRTLYYVKGGLALASVSVNGFDAGSGDGFRDRGTQFGWMLGAGLEYGITSNLSLGLDYTFIALSRDDRSGRTAAGVPFAIIGVDTDIHSLAARLNYRF